jgi:hypothetical protein
MAYDLNIDRNESVKKLIGDLQDAAKAAKGLNAEMKGVNDTIGDGTGGRKFAPPPAYASKTSDYMNWGTVGPSGARYPWKGNGPRQQLEQAEEGLKRARQLGDEALTKDQENRVRSLRLRVAKADRALDDTPKSPADAMRDMLMTSRFDPVTGRMFPLVNKAMAAGYNLSSPEGSHGAAQGLAALGIGAGKDLAPVIARAASALVPLAVGAAGVAAVVGAAESGSAILRADNKAFYTMGGTPGGVGSALALGGENAATKAMQLADRLREGSYGSAFLRSRGIMDYGPAQVDKSTNYVRSLDALRSVKDINQRIRIARDTGLTDDLWTSDLSQGTYNALKRSRAGAGSEGDRRTEAEYTAKKERLGNIIGKGWKWLAGGR